MQVIWPLLGEGIIDNTMMDSVGLEKGATFTQVSVVGDSNHTPGASVFQKKEGKVGTNVKSFFGLEVDS